MLTNPQSRADRITGADLSAELQNWLIDGQTQESRMVLSRRSTLFDRKSRGACILPENIQALEVLDTIVHEIAVTYLYITSRRYLRVTSTKYKVDLIKNSKSTT
jgi:hypothetical protein